MSTKGKFMNSQDDAPKIVVNPFLVYIGLGLAALLLQAAIPLPSIPAGAARAIGIVLMVANFIFGLPALQGMLKSKTSPNPSRPATSLVISGPYRITRNPMYVGLALLYCGLMVFFQITWGVLITPVVIWLVTVWVIRPEETYLEGKFGAEYINYKNMVHRWI